MKAEIKEWECKKDLTPYVDSMLFESGTSICQLTVEYPRGVRIGLDLVVAGEVSVTYKGEAYHSPTDFPEELVELIKAHPGEDFNVYFPSGEGNDDAEGDCYVTLNNWFELMFKLITPDDESLDGFTDGDVFESDISKMSPEALQADLLEYANNLCQLYGLATDVKVDYTKACYECPFGNGEGGCTTPECQFKYSREHNMPIPTTAEWVRRHHSED